MAARYKIRLKDQTGVIVAEFDDLRRLSYRHRINTPVPCVIQLHELAAPVALFEQDGQLELWRRDPVNGIPWYLEWEGLIVSYTRQADGSGDRTYTAYCTGYLDLLQRRTIAYRAGSAQADKSGTASTVMREFVRENAGDLATVANGREAHGVMPGLAIGADPAAGGTWVGGRFQKNLLDVLQGMADDAGIDFDLIGTTPEYRIGGTVPIPSHPDWEFRVYPGQRGRDLTLTGFDPFAHEDAPQLGPVVFALEFGNMAVPQYSASQDGSINRVYVLGPGEGATRQIEVRANGAAGAMTQYNIREAARNASNAETVAQLQQIGDEVLAENQARESFAFQVLQIPSTLYGYHYSWGDRVTARYGDIQRDKRIVGVSVDVTPDGETINLEIAEVP